MNIAYLINQYPKVSHSFIRREILALEKQGVNVHRFALRGWNAEVVDGDDVQEMAVTHYVLKKGLLALLKPVMMVLSKRPQAFLSALFLAAKTGYRADRPLPLHLAYFAEACELFLCLREAEVQHVHAHFGTNSTEIAMLVHALGGPPYSFTVHGPEEFDKPKTLKLGDKVCRAKFVAAISSYGKSQLYRTVAHEYWDKVNVVHCGLEQGFYDFPVTPVPDINQVVCVGRLCEQKGQLLLVEAIRVLSENNIDIKLVLAGDGEMRPAVEALIRQYHLEENIRITGWISSDQVREELLASRALVLPSFAEGLPVVIMEAMALHRPVLSTYVAGIPELVIPGENGWLFPAGSVQPLVDALTDCLVMPLDQLRLMGEAGHRRVVVRHDIDTEAKKLVELFEK